MSSDDVYLVKFYSLSNEDRDKIKVFRDLERAIAWCSSFIENEYKFYNLDSDVVNYLMNQLEIHDKGVFKNKFEEHMIKHMSSDSFPGCDNDIPYFDISKLKIK